MLRERLQSLSSVLLALGLLLAGTAVFSQDRSDGNPGALTIVGKGGKAEGFCPLKHTDVAAGISGFIARVVVTQDFENTSAEKIEAVYTFPLPQDAAVDEMTIQIDGRVVRGVIKKREDAAKIYREAIQKGQVAALLDQERPNIFTQSVGNIPPQTAVRVTIAFLVRLKYEDGTYEFSFPTVVGPRYIPGAPTGAQSTGFSADTTSVPDASKITPRMAPGGMRTGHDISIALMLDAGVPVYDMRSPTHEIDVERNGASSALVRLRNLAEIPNKDFVFRYTVAGPQIVEGLLTHATPGTPHGQSQDKTSGFFSLIIQPPERFTNSDVSPKELVFVMDSSGSMSGFPIEKSKRLMLNALNGLYAGDTFNIIRFSGDTAILFPEPMNPTGENVAKAKKFIEGHYGGGGTEMMKAILAALAPSDAQDHIRIVVFLTDGFVGNDLEIIGEIQKHPNARVFAYGIGSSVNRFLLDGMAKAGRGEVEYVSAKMDEKEAQQAADRLYERLRAPLLTDISLDFGSLPVADIYPKQIRDLFSARPVVITGRYTAPASGTVHLMAKRAGAPYSRDIPINFPSIEESNTALPKLWARDKIDDLMSQDWAGLQRGTMRNDLRDQITQLGLDFSLMTQFTSFVAVEEQIVTEGGQPKRIDVPVELPEDVKHEAQWSEQQPSQSPQLVPSQQLSQLATNGRNVMQLTALVPGAATECVTVEASVISVQSETSDVSSVQTVGLPGPVPGGTIQALTLTNSGAQTSSSDADKAGQLSQNGLRTTSNYWTIDGASANVGAVPVTVPSLNLALAASTPAFNAWGGTNSMISLDAIEELKLTSSGAAAEYGRTPGAHVEIASKAGTNRLHGSSSYSFGNERLNANDWFSNHNNVAKPDMRLNIFSGTVGGPLVKEKLFFFASYEGMRALQPQPGVTTYVPSNSLRTSRSIDPGLRSLLSAYPISDLPEVSIGGVAQGYSPFTYTTANPLNMDAFSLRIDHNASSTLAVKSRFTISDADFSTVTVPTRTSTSSAMRSFTVDVSKVFSPTVLNDLIVNYTQNRAHQKQRVFTNFGAVAPRDEVSLPGVSAQATNPSAMWSFWNGANTPQPLVLRDRVANLARQWNLIDSLSWVNGAHNVKFGGDFRYLFPSYSGNDYSVNAFFADADAIRANTATDLRVSGVSDTTVVSKNLSLYAQDQWKVTRRLTLNYGVRWEFNPAPHTTEGALRYVTGWQTPSTALAFAPEGTPAYGNNYSSFAPRFGVAYDPFGQGTTVIRGAVGIFYDLPSSAIGAGYGYYPNFRSYAADPVARAYPFNASLLPGLPAPVFTAPYPTSMILVGVAPGHASPRIYEYNLGVQREMPGRMILHVEWVGNNGRRLMRQYIWHEGYGDFINPNFRASTLFVSRNDGVFGDSSGYNAMQVRLRRYSGPINFDLNYTWSHAIDTGSDDITPTFISTGDLPATNRGASSFDRRHNVSAIVNYKLPRLHGNGRRGLIGKVFVNEWFVDSIIKAQSGMPGNVLWSRYMYDSAFGPGSVATFRAERIAGDPLWIDDSAVPGGRRLNYAAFAIPACAFGDPVQSCNGSLQRNGIVGLGTWQADIAITRQFQLNERASLRAMVKLFNAFNHANFGQSGGTLATVQGIPGSVPPGYSLIPSGAAVPDGLPYAGFGAPSQTAAQAYGATGASGGLAPMFQTGGPRSIQFALKLEF